MNTANITANTGDNIKRLLSDARILDIKSTAERIDVGQDRTGQLVGLLSIARSSAFSLEDLLENPEDRGLAQALVVILKRLQENVFGNEEE